MSRITTIIFDVSGVLLNDIKTVWKADSDAYQALGLPKRETIQKFKQTFKLPTHEYHKTMGVPDNLIPKLENEYRQAYTKHSHHITIFPEVENALEKLKKQKITLAIASNIPSQFLKEHLQRFKIDKYFDVVTGQDDCTEQKPSPKPILITLEKLGSKSDQSAYVGDMEEDIIAGKRAHVHTFAVCRDDSYHPDWRLRRQNPDFLISDLKELLAILGIIPISQSKDSEPDNISSSSATGSSLPL
ncbi:MAG: HAD family hydrolase [Candidatus Bathyarchaeia archaeon]